MSPGPDYHGWTHLPKAMGGTDPVAGGMAIFEIKLFEDDVVAVIRDWKYDIPADLDGALLVDVEAWVTGASSSGTITVMIRNATQGVDMLSTAVTIDVGEKNDKDAVTPFVINLANDQVAYGDEIWVRVTSAGTGALGLGVKNAYTPSANAAITLQQGAKGNPGGVTSYQGDWTTATTYNAGDVIVNNGVVYVATADNTSSATTEPGVGATWETVWETLVDLPMVTTAHCNVFGNGYVLYPGEKGAVRMPFDGTITEAALLADIAGDVVVDIWKSSYAGYPPSSANSIVASAPPTLTGQIKNLDSTLTGWTTAVTAGDILVFVLKATPAPALLRRLTIVLKITKGA